jgi:hypothetical protein
LLRQNLNVQYLCSREEMNASELQSWNRQQAVENSVEVFFIHTERSRPATHAHGATLSFSAGIDAKRDAGTRTQTIHNCSYTLRLQKRFDVDLADAVPQDQLKLSRSFARSGKDNVFSGTSGGERSRELARRGNLEPGSLRQKVLQHRMIGICFDRVEDGKLGRQGPAQTFPLMVDGFAVIDEQRRPIAICQLRNWLPADQKFASRRCEIFFEEKWNLIHSQSPSRRRSAG